MNESNNEDNKINKIEKNNIIKSKTFEMTVMIQHQDKVHSQV